MLGLVVLLAAVTFQYLTQTEVRRVLSVHALDKTTHLAEMLEADDRQVNALRTGRLEMDALVEFASMARSVGVASVSFFDPDGVPFGRVLLGADNMVRMANPAGTGSEDHFHGQHGHDHAGHDAHALIHLSALPGPDLNALRPLLEGDQRRLVTIDTLADPEGHAIHYASVTLPLEITTADRFGYVHFLLSTGNMHAAYANGVFILGALFMASCVVLFGIPALAFWVQKRAAERSSQEAAFHFQHDVLTGVLNRTAFQNIAETRLRDGQVGYVVYVDVDCFKQINDLYGHVVGDELLRRLSGLMRAVLGEAAVIARLAGDEFAVLLPAYPRAELDAFCQELLHVTAGDHSFGDVVLSTTLSLGVAEPASSDSLDDVLHRADTALFYAKSGGGNRMCHYEDAMGTAAHRRRFLETRVRAATRGREFQLFYQPLVDARTLQPVGYEALLRLNEPDGTPIPPFEFVPVAEETGLIEDIGTWVLNTATRDMAEFDSVTGVSVNLSVEQFRSGRLVDYVRTALRLSGLAPERLELEVTESLLIGEDIDAAYQIDTLKELGIRVAIDDFGTGYSSLSTLWRYGFDRIKIDKSFVAALNDAPERSQQLIDSIVLLGDRMGMKVTAEGIETEEQRHVLLTLGCDVLQGYFFGRPAPLETYLGAPQQKSAG